MNKLATLLLGGTALVGAGLLAAQEVVNAQSAQGTVVTQSASKADVATFLQTSAGGRTTCSTTQDTVANLTVTLTPPAGQYVYITGVYFDSLANATGATSTTVFSSTNLTGSPAWLVPTTATAAANPSGATHIAESYPTALKSTVAGTAVTILPQATSASAFLCVRVAGYFNGT